VSDSSAPAPCGPARELFVLLQQYPALGPHLDVALIDQEERALAFCERTLAPLAHATGARIQFIRESVRRLVAARQLEQAVGPQDLVYSAGLFDYLSARSFSALLDTLYRALAPGGQLLVGNVGTGNPTRSFMEYCLDWFLIHRSREQLRGFARELEPEPSRVEVAAESLGVNLFLRVWKSPPA
jgi:extracellular factor (EF) 3-hydroxypalmitic acid methyl ester biosynthesis protein